MKRRDFTAGFLTLMGFGGLATQTPARLRAGNVVSANYIESYTNDGDSFLVETVRDRLILRIRLEGVDTPELGRNALNDRSRFKRQQENMSEIHGRHLDYLDMQRLARRASTFTRNALRPTCRIRLGRVIGSRQFGTVTLHDGRDLASELVNNKLAYRT